MTTEDKSNAQRLGGVAHDFMDQLDKYPEGARIGTIMIVAEVSLPPDGSEERGNDGLTLTSTWSNDGRGFVQVGLLHTALLSLKSRAQ